MAHLVGHQKLVGVGADFFKRGKLDERLLEKLNDLMLSVAALLGDAEEKHITEFAAVKTWLEHLRDVMYEADDFLDEIYYDAMRLEMETGAPVTCCYKSVPFLNTFKKWMKRKPVQLGEILDRLQDLVNQKVLLGLVNGIGGVPVTPRNPIALVNRSLVYGRDADKDAIKKLLLSADAADATKNFAVISIVGMGGLGKSTLACIVFDEAVQFDLKAWVCISEEYNVERIVKGILQIPETSHVSTLPGLIMQLQEKLKGKRYLLVFDDVWQHRWAQNWKTLEVPLSCGERGSRIIVTTREHEVARVMNATPYALKKLSDEDSGKLLARHALGCEDYSCLNSVRLQIFEEIVQKSSGLPLASEMIGRLMYGKDAHSWKIIAKSNLRNLPSNVEILPTLRMSYHHLPSHLKQCFAYCAIIPKGHVFKKEEMVRLWMAEGFLRGPKELANMVIEEENMEELGRAYFDDLVSRSLFHQQDDEGEDFIMHDQIIDLARSVSGGFCHTFESEGACKIRGRARHVSCRGPEAHNLLQRCKDGAKSLRTFLPFPMRKEYVMNSEFGEEALDDLLSTLKCLRVLSVSGYSGIDNLPDSIGGMKHLRYFDLSRTSIESLPQAVGLLYSLETLILEDCRRLTMLPDSIGNLSNLYYLNIDGTAITRLPNSLIRLHELQTFIFGSGLKEMPPVGQLRKLKQLSRFIVGREGRSRARELGQLNLLRGKLSICNLENIVNAEDALEARLKDKERLVELVLVWDSSIWRAGSFNVLKNLEPCMMLERLSVHGYGAPRFPNWMGDSSFSYMVELEITDCKNCSSLPSLGQLPSLKKLFIKGFSSLVVVGLEFYGRCTSREPFGSLEELHFEEMPEWSQWIPYGEAESSDSGGPFPLLQKLVIKRCPKLRYQHNGPGQILYLE